MAAHSDGSVWYLVDEMQYYFGFYISGSFHSSDWFWIPKNQSHHYCSAKENLVKGRVASITLLVFIKTLFFSILDSSPAKVHKPLHDRPLSVSSTKSSQIRSFSPFRATIRSSQNSAGGGVYGSVIYHNRPPQTRLRCGKYYVLQNKYVAFYFLVKLTFN